MSGKTLYKFPSPTIDHFAGLVNYALANGSDMEAGYFLECDLKLQGTPAGKWRIEIKRIERP